MASDSLGDDGPTDGPPRAVFIAAIVVAVAAVVTVLAIAATREPTRTPVPIAAVPAPAAGDPYCGALMTALPEQLGDYRRAAAVEPVPQGAAAWQADPGTDPVVLRCGLDRPADFVVGTPLQMVDEVSWFRVAESDRTTWFAVDRPVYVALTLPRDSGPTPIQKLSDVIVESLPARPIAPGPVQ